MKKRYWLGLIVLAAAGLAVAVLRPGAPASAPAALPAPAAALDILDRELADVAPRALARTLPVTGTLQAAERTVLKTRVAGTLLSLQVKPGMAVKRGDVLGRIDPVNIQAQVRAREAELASAQASADQSARHRDAQRALLDKGFISPNAFDGFQKDADVARATRDAARAQLDLVRQSLADATLRAPMDGVVAERFAEPGETLPMDAQILSILDISRFEVEIAVPAAEIGTLRLGQSLALEAEGLAETLQGRVVRIAPSTASGTRSVPVYLAVANPGSHARAGMFVRGTLLADRHEAAATLPLGAVREERGQTVVYALEGNTLRRRPVSVTGHGNADGDDWLDIDGLPVGTRVLRAPAGPLADGTAVRVVAAPDRTGS